MAIRRLSRCLRPAPIVLILALVGGCAGPTPLGQMFSPDVYTVRAGDTLYAIAWRYERSVQDLIRWNDLDNPDQLRPGQRIHLSPRGDGGARVARSDETPGSQSGSQSAQGTAERTISQESAGSKPASSRADEEESSGEPTGEVAGTIDSGDWRWPATGELVGTFANGRAYGRGIDIAGREGQDVHAAAAGRVVYSGEGLQAYGPLIIIRHSSTYLSAYAHNSRLLVSEGDSVEAGDRIAEMGLAPGDEALLHFEIRRDGTPVDPLEYLPARE